MNDLIKDIKELISYVDEKTAINEEQRRIRFVISSDKIDRDNEKIEVSAVANAIPTFAKNPVALACHTHRLDNGKSSVIGHWDTVSFKANAHTSEMDLIFAETELGKEYFQLYKDKHMRAVSIGFRSKEWHEESDAKNGRFIVFTKIELYEISACAVGANREALSKVKDFFAGNEKEVPQIVKDYLDKHFEDIKEHLTDQIEELKDLLSDPDGFAAFMLGKNSDQLDPADDNNSKQKVLEQIAETIQNYLN